MTTVELTAPNGYLRVRGWDLENAAIMLRRAYLAGPDEYTPSVYFWKDTADDTTLEVVVFDRGQDQSQDYVELLAGLAKLIEGQREAISARRGI